MSESDIRPRKSRLFTIGKWDILNISIQFSAVCPVSDVFSEGIISDIKSFATITINFQPK
jgi:hypothetical protein